MNHLTVWTVILYTLFLAVNSETKTTSKWISDISDSAWTIAYSNMIKIKVTEISESIYQYSETSIGLTSGKAYVIRFIASSNNTKKHYFTAPDFFKAVAVKKAESLMAEYYAPLFTDLELFFSSISQNNNNYIDIYIVPVVNGN